MTVILIPPTVFTIFFSNPSVDGDNNVHVPLTLIKLTLTLALSVAPEELICSTDTSDEEYGADIHEPPVNVNTSPLVGVVLNVIFPIKIKLSSIVISVLLLCIYWGGGSKVKSPKTKE